MSAILAVMSSAMRWCFSSVTTSFGADAFMASISERSSTSVGLIFSTSPLIS